MELEIIIGLEIHAHLSTKSKLFSPADNNIFSAEPNTRINEIDLGFPGTLPVLNAEGLEKAAAAAVALGGKVQEFSKFDRKHYFYPDLPFGYQISQYDQPLSLGGAVKILLDDEIRSIGITRLHLEHDAGKLTHTTDASLVDYNRAGCPLIEIVTEPDMRSAAEAQALAKEIQKILRAAGSSDADMEKGKMRFDASISLRPMGESKLYPRAEIKNLNSFTSLGKALEYEIARQTELWNLGTPPTKETTVGWMDKAQKTQILRDKESADDYRYFPEPDLPPVIFSAEKIAAFEAAKPELPLEKYERYQSELGLSAQDALKLSESPRLASFFETAAQGSGDPKKTANLILSVVLAQSDWARSLLTEKDVADTADLLIANKISSNGAKEILEAAMETEISAEKIMEKLGLEQVSDTGELELWIDDVLTQNPETVADYRGGKTKVFGFLVGQVMKKSRGAANPAVVSEMMKAKLEA